MCVRACVCVYVCVCANQGACSTRLQHLCARPQQRHGSSDASRGTRVKFDMTRNGEHQKLSSPISGIASKFWRRVTDVKTLRGQYVTSAGL